MESKFAWNVMECKSVTCIKNQSLKQTATPTYPKTCCRLICFVHTAIITSPYILVWHFCLACIKKL